MRNAGFALGGVVGLLIGASVGWIARPDGAGSGPVSSDGRAGDAMATVTERLEGLAKQLDSILEEMRVRAPNSPTVADPSGLPVRTEETDLRAYLETRLNELSEQIRRTTAGIGEIGKLKPIPDVAALRTFQKECAQDSAAALRRITGMTYRDATLEFGVPSLKQRYENVRGPTGGKLTIWLWQVPAEGFEVIMSFENDAAVWAQSGRLGSLKDYMDQLGKDK